MKIRRVIEWGKLPRFELLNVAPHNKVICFEAGHVFLNAGRVDFPVGWSTDITSTPRPLTPLVPTIGGHNSFSILYDRLLDLGWKREDARLWGVEQLDNLFQDGKISATRKFLCHAGIWIKDQKEKLKCLK